MSEIPEDIMAKAEAVYDVLETTDPNYQGRPAERLDIKVIALAIKEAKAEERDELQNEITHLLAENEALRGKVGRLERLNEYHQKRAEFAGRHVLALREALKPFAEMCADIESCAAEYPTDHPASSPDGWFTGFEWGDLLRARSVYEGEVK